MRKLSYLIFVAACIAILMLVFLSHPRAEYQPGFARIEPVPGISNFARLAPGIWRGEAPGEDGLDWLKKNGVRTIIDFRTRGEHEGLDNDPAIMYVRLPFSATNPPPEVVVEKFFETVTDPANQPVYFHCRYGKDRTGTFAALYRIKVQGWDTKKAVAEMKYFGFRRFYRDLIGYVRSQEPENLDEQKQAVNKAIREWAERAKITRSELEIRITPKKTTFAPSRGKSRGEDIMILGLPIEITNRSKTQIKSIIAHEWYGGEWPSTDLYACGVYERFKVPPRVIPVFLVGEKGELTKPTMLKPGESLTFNLRMDRPGTGSCPATPMMDKDVSRAYQFKIVLVFEADGKGQYVESPVMEIRVQGMNQLDNER